MFFKRSITAIGAAAILAAATVMPCMADAKLETPKADENGVYCQAGIVFQIRDQWDHRNEIKLEPLNEKEDTVVDISFKDVNITGNGEYTVEMSGYMPDFDEYLMGFLAVELDIDFSKYSNVEDGKVIDGVSFEVLKANIDGTEYTFTTGLDEEGEPYQPLENGEKFENNQQIIKIKNGWGTLHDGFSTPEMPGEVWKTADPLTITFKVSGFPTDKIEGFENEVVERVYGKGTNVEADESSQEEASSAADESKADESVAESKADSSKADAASSASDSSSTSDSKGDSSNIGLIAGIAGAAVLVIIIIAVVIKKKS